MQILLDYRGQLMFMFVITLSLAFALLTFFAWHMFLIMTGQTTIEWYLNKVCARSTIDFHCCLLSFSRLE